MSDGIGAVVLAAGSATRFGGDKLATVFQGAPLLTNVLGTVARGLGDGIVRDAVVVHRPADTWVDATARDAGMQPVANPAPERGLASSVHCGLEALMPTECAWAMILLGDQPLVRAEVLTALARAAAEAGADVDLIRPRYAEDPDTPGHPVMLHRRCWAGAATLEGDRGPGTLVPPARTREIPVPGSNPDVDRPDDLTRLTQR